MRFDLNLFRVFDAIYATGSLTRAGELLHLTQPAVSHALGRLRSRFGDPLFRREGRGMVATPRAHALAPGVRQALALLDAGLRAGHDFEPSSAVRRFAVGLREVIEMTMLPGLLTVLRAEAPGVTLASVQFARESVARDLARGQLDLVMDIALPLGPEIHRESLFDDPLCIVMRRDHPLAVAPLAQEDWLAGAHVVVSGRPSGLSLEDAALQRAGLHRQVQLRCQSYASGCAAVATSDLLLALPGRVAREQARRFPLHIAPAPMRLPSFRVQLYWHHSAEDDAGSRWLRDRLRAVADRESADRPSGDEL
ncbi:LysR family transcriptional regulator [Algiphilus aromaticivorans]|uniref:LysR family transcriptional regulator n=1 Tax=Algiphilus aromaticivorans TaxID=382454 RepID=UPI0005C1E0B1|nr:LysR family transcriptional regulator [Algiphilus aromaticivorans]